jgi:hypothetical protein
MKYNPHIFIQLNGSRDLMPNNPALVGFSSAFGIL